MVGVFELAVTKYHVFAVPCLAAEVMPELHFPNGSSLRAHVHFHRCWGLFRISALAAFEAHGIVVDIHIAAIDEHIGAYIQVERRYSDPWDSRRFWPQI